MECAELTPCRSVRQRTVKRDSCSVYVVSFIYEYSPNLLAEQSVFMNQSHDPGKVPSKLSRDSGAVISTG